MFFDCFHFLSLYGLNKVSQEAKSHVFSRKMAVEKTQDRISRKQNFATFLNMIRSYCEFFRSRAGLSFSLSSHKIYRTSKTSTLSILLDSQSQYFSQFHDFWSQARNKLSMNSDRLEHFGSILCSSCK